MEDSGLYLWVQKKKKQPMGTYPPHALKCVPVEELLHIYQMNTNNDGLGTWSCGIRPKWERSGGIIFGL